MQAAAKRLPIARGQRRADNNGGKPHLATADDTGLLDALPIAAAIIERDGEQRLKVIAYNSRFLGTVEQSSCEALDWDDAECLKAGPIPDLLQKFFDGTDVTGEL